LPINDPTRLDKFKIKLVMVQSNMVLQKFFFSVHKNVTFKNVAYNAYKTYYKKFNLVHS